MSKHPLWSALLLLLLVSVSGAAFGAAPPVAVLTVDDAIGPATADYLVRGLDKAAQEQAQLVVIRMDTPGGLDSSMRAIIKAILASPVPVATFVTPGGARAASAGTYILYASHVAAMSPGTNLGAATPVQLGGVPGAPDKPAGDKPAKPDSKADDSNEATLTRKQVNDAAAYIRGLAQLRGRNAEWAERAVREAVSLPAEEALKQRVIDRVASDLPALLSQLDGQTLKTARGEVVLHTAGAPLVEHAPDWRARLLAVITNPSVALILMMIGIYGLIFEFANPGSAIGGVVGGICLILGLYALQLLPVSYAGMALVLLGLALMAAEAFMPSFGALGLGGVVAFVVGAVILIDTEVPGFGIPLPLIVGLALASAALIIGVVGVALRARRDAPVSGDAGLVGSLAAVAAVQADDPLGGWVQLQGERWQVRSSAPLWPGQRVRVVAREGLRLAVEAADNPAHTGE
ncbi:nodulation protein NfeD [Pseudomonas sp. UL073]|uniref:Nodulation protein NfeD n=1 Tax=Zestomonas insulae TaxID=2809017 RepID=A0ABS2IGW0_9GAMM|nr:nodulation protein NfeD [Pseudomonas insulae]MBM7062307.1 nodulation protein NfeD [Pseudomonas insulae]